MHVSEVTYIFKIKNETGNVIGHVINQPMFPMSNFFFRNLIISFLNQKI